MAGRDAMPRSGRMLASRLAAGVLSALPASTGVLPGFLGNPMNLPYCRVAIALAISVFALIHYRQASAGAAQEHCVAGKSCVKPNDTSQPTTLETIVVTASMELSSMSYIGAWFGGGGHGRAHSDAPNFSSNNSTPTSDKAKNKKGSCPDYQGDPIEISSGTKLDTYTDFALPGEMGLAFIRYYDSDRGWSTNLDYRLDDTCGSIDNCHHTIISP